MQMLLGVCMFVFYPSIMSYSFIWAVAGIYSRVLWLASGVKQSNSDPSTSQLLVFGRHLYIFALTSILWSSPPTSKTSKGSTGSYRYAERVPTGTIPLLLSCLNHMSDHLGIEINYNNRLCIFFYSFHILKNCILPYLTNYPICKYYCTFVPHAPMLASD